MLFPVFFSSFIVHYPVSSCKTPNPTLSRAGTREAAGEGFSIPAASLPPPPSSPPVGAAGGGGARPSSCAVGWRGPSLSGQGVMRAGGQAAATRRCTASELVWRGLEGCLVGVSASTRQPDQAGRRRGPRRHRPVSTTPLLEAMAASDGGALPRTRVFKAAFRQGGIACLGWLWRCDSQASSGGAGWRCRLPSPGSPPTVRGGWQAPVDLLLEGPDLGFMLG